MIPPEPVQCTECGAWIQPGRDGWGVRYPDQHSPECRLAIPESRFAKVSEVEHILGKRIVHLLRNSGIERLNVVLALDLDRATRWIRGFGVGTARAVADLRRRLDPDDRERKHYEEIDALVDQIAERLRALKERRP